MGLRLGCACCWLLRRPPMAIDAPILTSHCDVPRLPSHRRFRDRDRDWAVASPQTSGSSARACQDALDHVRRAAGCARRAENERSARIAASPCRLAAACECSQSALSAARPAARRLAMRVPHVIRRDAAGFAAARPFRRRAKSSLVPFALIACESMRAVRSPHKVVVRLCLRYSCNVM